MVAGGGKLNTQGGDPVFLIKGKCIIITMKSLWMFSSFSSQAYPQMKLFINPINWFVSIQRMLIILIVEAGFRNWIQHDIMEDSHLDKYFLLLAILSGRNLCLHALGRMSSHHKCTMHIYWLKAQKYMWRGYEWTSKAGIGLTLQKHKKAASGGGVR